MMTKVGVCIQITSSVFFYFSFSIPNFFTRSQMDFSHSFFDRIYCHNNLFVLNLMKQHKHHGSTAHSLAFPQCVKSRRIQTVSRMYPAQKHWKNLIKCLNCRAIFIIKMNGHLLFDQNQNEIRWNSIANTLFTLSE